MPANLNGRPRLIELTEQSRLDANSDLDVDRRIAFGQFMTPFPVAAFMAGMFDFHQEHVRLLDAGAGVGSLTAAFVAEACLRASRPTSIEASAFEIEPAMLERLPSVLRKCDQTATKAGVKFTGRIEVADFIVTSTKLLASNLFARRVAPTFNAAILNPPYRKIHSQSKERALLRTVGIETSNLYTAFVALAIRLLEPGGELVAITPRSFCNGPYFRPFRQLLLSEMSLVRVHVFDARDRAFEEDAVLQENVIFHAKKGVPRVRIALSASVGPHAEVRTRTVPYDQVVHPRDPQAFIHLAMSEQDGEAARRIGGLPCTLTELGLQVSTGRVVDFRARKFLRQDPGPRTVPLVYPSHFEAGRVAWPRTGGRKPNALVDAPETRSLMLANETYVLTKRFTSKEERRRIVAAVCDPTHLPSDAQHVGFENHLNYFHASGSGLPKATAAGLAAFLNTSLADCYFRQFNGHTQVNASDLRNFRYPSLDQLKAIGRRIGSKRTDQEGLDGIVDGVLAPPPKDSAR